MARIDYYKPISKYAQLKGYRHIFEYYSERLRTTVRWVIRFDPQLKLLDIRYTIADALSNFRHERVSKRDALYTMATTRDWDTRKDSWERVVIDLDGTTLYEELPGNPAQSCAKGGD